MTTTQMATLEETRDEWLERAQTPMSFDEWLEWPAEEVVAMVRAQQTHARVRVAAKAAEEMEAWMAGVSMTQMTVAGGVEIVGDAMYWAAVHREMMSWDDGEYEPNGYQTRPTIPLGVPFAIVNWTQAWEDITKHIPVSIDGLASFGQIHTISNDFIFSGPPVIGVRV